MPSPPPVPPPPPPPSSPPSRSAPPPLLSQRHEARRRRREAAVATRQQRALTRAQQRQGQRTSVLGPLLLVSAGLSALVMELLHVPASGILLWLGRWWPALLVAAGLVLGAEWMWDTRSDQQRGIPGSRRRLGGLTVFLLFLLFAVGFSASFLANASTVMQGFNAENTGNPWPWAQFLGAQSEKNHSLTAALSPRGMLIIPHFRGKITASGTSVDGQVHVDVRQHFWAWHRADLEREQSRYQPTLTADGPNLLLQATSEGSQKTDLNITLPVGASLDVDSEGGDISVRQMQGNVKLVSQRGDLHLEGIRGGLDLMLQDKNAVVTGSDLTGDLQLRGQAGDVNLSDVQGAVTLQGDFYGTTHLARITNAVHFESSRTHLACAAVSGELDLEGREDLRGHGLTGPLTVSTSDRDIDLTEVRQGAEISAQGGDVSLGLLDPLAATKVWTKNGDLHVHLPGSANLHLEADTRNGQIQAGGRGSPEQSGDGGHLSIVYGKGGPVTAFHTDDGDIMIDSAKPIPLPLATNASDERR